MIDLNGTGLLVPHSAIQAREAASALSEAATLCWDASGSDSRRDRRPGPRSRLPGPGRHEHADSEGNTASQAL